MPNNKRLTFDPTQNVPKTIITLLNDNDDKLTYKDQDNNLSIIKVYSIDGKFPNLIYNGFDKDFILRHIEQIYIIDEEAAKQPAVRPAQPYPQSAEEPPLGPLPGASQYIPIGEGWLDNDKSGKWEPPRPLLEPIPGATQYIPTGEDWLDNERSGKMR